MRQSLENVDNIFVFVYIRLLYIYWEVYILNLSWHFFLSSSKKKKVKIESKCAIRQPFDLMKTLNKIKNEHRKRQNILG